MNATALTEAPMSRPVDFSDHVLSVNNLYYGDNLDSLRKHVRDKTVESFSGGNFMLNIVVLSTCILL